MTPEQIILAFAEGGRGREHFLTATGGAAWVDGLCDSIVNAIALDGEKGDLEEMLDAADENGLQKLTLWRTSDDTWQANITYDKHAWKVDTDYLPSDAIKSVLGRPKCD